MQLCSRVLKFSSKKKKKKAIAKISYFAKLEKVHSQLKVGLLSFSTESTVRLQEQKRYRFLVE